MTERRKRKRRDSEEEEKPTKEQCDVAKHLLWSLPSRQGKLVGMTVKIFIASEAVDLLLKSKWAFPRGKEPALFNNRRTAVDYMDNLMRRNLFHRAAKIQKKQKRKQQNQVAGDAGDTKTRKRKGGGVAGEEEEDGEAEVTETDDAPSSTKEKRKEKGPVKEEDEKEKEKRREEKRKRGKMRIEMHDSQNFVDGDEVYVWIYDPVRFRNFVLGLLLVLASVGLCLFPMWPEELRGGVYYLSMGGLVFMGAIMGLALFRYVVFGLVWACTFGRHHFWYLPNLTEDCGVLESFQPLYSHTVVGQSESASSATKSNNNGCDPAVKKNN